MSRNVALNALEERVRVAELNWLLSSQISSCTLILTVNPSYRGEPIPQDMLSSDLILAADCVYFEPAFPLLVQTLTDLTSMHDPEILFCYKKRRKVLGPLARAFS